MQLPRMPELRIGDRIAKLPIIQGGMGVGVSLAGLASAVANAGGVGMIASVGIGRGEPDFLTDAPLADMRALRKEIQLARSKTSGLIGVNVMLALSDCNELMQVAFEESVDLLVVGAGLLMKRPPNLSLEWFKHAHTKIMPKVSSARAVQAIYRYWARHYDSVPYGVMIEGPLAGGHLGFRRQELDSPRNTLANILTEVTAALKPFAEKLGQHIPIIVGGGIYSGADIYEFLKRGATGVLMGTRFVGTHECDAHIRFKEAYMNCPRDGLDIIESPVGLPGRAIHNQFLADVAAGIKKPYKCVWKCLKTCDFVNAPYCIAQALIDAKEGNLVDGLAFAGANAHRVRQIVSVQELVYALQREYAAASREAPALRTPRTRQGCLRS